MRISVNLASRPFVELRPFFARLRLVMAALVLVAIGLLVALHFEQQKLTAAQQLMAIEHRRTVAAQEEKRHNVQRMSEPANAAVLTRAHFLNALFLEKSFSWTAVMMDLENVLPSGVQVTAIEPVFTPEHDVVIRLRVSGDRERAVQLVRNLERSSRFLRPHLQGETPRTKEQGNVSTANAALLPPGSVEFDILAVYNPLPAPVEVTDKVSAGKVSSAKSAGSSLRVKSAKHAVKPGPKDGIVLKPYSAAKPSGGAR
jgi:type IV pilus assembly protein PilN